MATRRAVLAGLATVRGGGTLAAVPHTPVPDVASAAAPRLDRSTRHPLVIGHRGAPGYRPEHTLASYELAARLGADFIEPDLVPTRDGVLVCRHEPEISGTTDVADHQRFASRRRTVDLDGTPTTGWFTQDFTLAELRTLRAVERLPDLRQHNTLWNGRLPIPTFREVLELRARLSRELGRRIGVYPETKHPTYFQQLGLALEPRLLDSLRRHGLNRPDAPVFVQSFEVTNLQQLRAAGLRTPVIQLLSAAGSPYDTVAAGGGPSYAALSTPTGLASIARYAQGIGPDKNQVIPRAGDGTLLSPTSLVTDAHRVGLSVHPYTFRAENSFLPLDLRVGAWASDHGRAIEEQRAFLAAGVDGLFTDQPDLGVQARRQVDTPG